MSLFSLLAALLLEHFRPLNNRSGIYISFTRYANFLERQFNAGEHRHGMIAWLAAVLPLVIAVGIVYAVLHMISPVVAWMWNAAVLYITMGFKYFSNTSSSIADALRNHNLDEARALLQKWRPGNASELQANEIARLTIEQSFTCAHRQIFGVIAWFLVLSSFGPIGAVLYRLSSILANKWGEMEGQDAGNFGEFSARMFYWLDWVPSRLTAVSFAIVGDFEDAVYCWRSQAANWFNKAQGVVLASGAGALGIKLGDPIHKDGGVEFRPELGLGDDADPDYMESAISLIWRALVLWMLLLLLLHLAKWTAS
jgi:adenosylcobinamide-phosphate synthase